MSNTLPPGWASATLGQVCERPQYGWTTKSVPGPGLPYLRTTDISGGEIDWSSVPSATEIPGDPARFLLKHDDIVVSRAGSVGISHLIRNPPAAIFASYLIRLRVGDFVVPEYVALYLKSPAYWRAISETQVGIAIPNVNAKRLAAIGLPIAPLAEQKRIVSAIEEHFSRLDAAEAATDSSVRRVPSLLEAAVQARLHKYPTSSAPLHRFLIQRLSNGRSVPTATTDGFPVLRLTCLRDGSVATSETKQGDFGDVDPTRYVIEPDDFLISRGNGSLRLVGLGGLVPAGASSVAYPDTLIRARVDQSRLRPSFLSHIWNSRFVRKQLEAQARTTAGIYKINQTMIEQVSLPIPSPDDQDKIAQQLDELKASVRMTEREVERARRRIAELRRSVLTAAFSGRLVSQDPDDEPASVLLERIATSRPAEPARRRART